MKVIATLAIFVFLVACGGTQPVEPNAPSITIKELLDELEPGLAKLSNTAIRNRLELSSVELTLNTVLSEENSGSFGILIFSAGQSKKETSTNEYVVKLTKLEQSSITTSSSIEEFVAALEELVDSLEYKIAGLGTAEVAGTLSFVVLENSTVGATKKWEAVPANLSLSKSLSTSYTHKVKISVKRPE